MGGAAAGEGATDDAVMDNVPVDDAALMDLVATEDVRAFEALYRAYHPRLTRFLRRMLRQPTLAEEVLDDTMMVVWRKAHAYDASSKPSTWIFAIAYRQALKALRRVGPVLAFDADESAGVPESEPDGELQRHQLRTQLDRTIALLSPEHRAVIELTYFHGHSCREIAEITGCPVATVKTRMFYARHKLKSLLAGLAEGAL